MYTEMLKLLHPTPIRMVKIRTVTVERNVTKWILSIDMAMGRLEILAILILFIPQTWKK
jgi:Trk-type K+ transport system membrane component